MEETEVYKLDIIQTQYTACLTLPIERLVGFTWVGSLGELLGGTICASHLEAQFAEVS